MKKYFDDFILLLPILFSMLTFDEISFSVNQNFLESAGIKLATLFIALLDCLIDFRFVSAVGGVYFVIFFAATA